MPRFDGTGPAGCGPFTGRGMGYCVVQLDDQEGKWKTESGEEVSDMPRGDGTGPAGMGPMTGRGAGFCAGYSVPGYANPVYGRGAGFGFGRGLGRGFGRGLGRGRAAGAFGRGYPYYGAGAPYPAPYAPAELKPEQETDMLKQQAQVLQDELDAVNQRIKELKPAKGSGGSE